MAETDTVTGLQLRSTAKKEGILEISLATVATPAPKPEEVLVRVEASPINPSDLGLLLAGADLSTAKVSGTADGPVVTATIPPPALKAVAGRVGQSMPVGNEGAGVVVARGDVGGRPGAARQDGRRRRRRHVHEYRCIKAVMCLVLPAGTTPAKGAAWFVNPLTALGMVETMRAEGHKALVHTAAASNLGQMLNRICLKDGVPLVNIVRSAEHVALLKGIGAKHIVRLERADLHGRPHRGARRDRRHPRLRRHRRRQARRPDPQRHGGRHQPGGKSTAATAPTRTSRSTSTAASTAARPRSPATSAWPGASAAGCSRRSCEDRHRGRAEPPRARRRRAQDHLREPLHEEVSLAEALKLEEIAAYARQATGEKYLIAPNKGLR